MQYRQQSVFKLTALLLAGIALLQGFCFMKLHASPLARAGLPAHAGCHGSSLPGSSLPRSAPKTPAPKPPAVPLPHERCCTAPPAPQAAAVDDSLTPSWTVEDRVNSLEVLRLDSISPVSSETSQLDWPPGSRVLRV
jgi:hypothetical protein